jgi:hypothetical protein
MIKKRMEPTCDDLAAELLRDDPRRSADGSAISDQSPDIGKDALAPSCLISGPTSFGASPRATN